MPKIRVAIAGLGNCASSLIQGLTYYHDADPSERIPGLMHVKFGDYHISDLEIVGAFEINSKKIGKDIAQAIWEEPNCTTKFCNDVPKNLNAFVEPGPISDGVASHMQKSFSVYDETSTHPANIVDKLKEWKADVLVNFIPVGSEEATRLYAQGCIDAGVALANGIPTFIVSDPLGGWPKKFTDAGIPCAGDDIKSQLGATILHRTLARLAQDRGIEIEKTYQLNIGGNTDFENMKFEERLETKRISKTSAVTSLLDKEVPTRIGPSDYVPFLRDNKICYLYMTGRNFGDCPVSVEVKLSVEDSPNSAGVMIDVIRALRIAKDRKISGPLTSVSSYFFKHPPVQIPDSQAFQLVEDFIAGKITN
ncbi:MAG: inositol-3-phosphate synthase [Candidatus Thorarchaeota archaeon]